MQNVLYLSMAVHIIFDKHINPKKQKIMVSVCVIVACLLAGITLRESFLLHCFLYARASVCSLVTVGSSFGSVFTN